MSNRNPRLFLLGANHKSASMELREALYIAPEQLAALLPETKERFGFLELAALSTCNRFELMGAVRDTAAHESRLYEAYLHLQRSVDNATGRSDEEIKKALYLHLDDDAVSHVYRVASSLDSLVVGETQITGQFKDAIDLAMKTHTLGPLLTRLSQSALATAKKIRSQTGIGEKHVSISHAAIDLAGRVFGQLGDHKFLVIGAGEMSQVAAKYILSYNPRELYVANRTVENASKMVRELGRGEAFSLEELPSLIYDADVVVSSTAAPHAVIPATLVGRAQNVRRSRPLMLLDIALPRDVDPACGDFEDVYLFDIDDLEQVVDHNRAQRLKAAETAQKMIDEAVAGYLDWLRTHSFKPALKGFREYLDDLFTREAEKSFRSGLKNLDEDQRKAVENLLEAVAGKMSGDASRAVKSPPEGYFEEQLADALETLFPGPKNGSD